MHDHRSPSDGDSAGHLSAVATAGDPVSPDDVERRWDEQEKQAWREVAEGYRRAVLGLDVDHPERAQFRRLFDRAAHVAGLRAPGERHASLAPVPPEGEASR
jgi:hypothetical protein